eukprot:EG_transcript_3906
MAGAGVRPRFQVHGADDWQEGPGPPPATLREDSRFWSRAGRPAPADRGAWRKCEAAVADWHRLTQCSTPEPPSPFGEALSTSVTFDHVLSPVQDQELEEAEAELVAFLDGEVRQMEEEEPVLSAGALRRHTFATRGGARRVDAWVEEQYQLWEEEGAFPPPGDNCIVEEVELEEDVTSLMEDRPDLWQRPTYAPPAYCGFDWEAAMAVTSPVWAARSGPAEHYSAVRDATLGLVPKHHPQQWAPKGGGSGGGGGSTPSVPSEAELQALLDRAATASPAAVGELARHAKRVPVRRSLVALRWHVALGRLLAEAFRPCVLAPWPSPGRDALPPPGGLAGRLLESSLAGTEGMAGGLPLRPLGAPLGGGGPLLRLRAVTEGSGEWAPPGEGEEEVGPAPDGDGAEAHFLSALLDCVEAAVVDVDATHHLLREGLLATVTQVLVWLGTERCQALQFLGLVGADYALQRPSLMAQALTILRQVACHARDGGQLEEARLTCSELRSADRLWQIWGSGQLLGGPSRRPLSDPCGVAEQLDRAVDLLTLAARGSAPWCHLCRQEAERSLALRQS